jgi:isopropylmalate/homocitrate/citramalate synthase
LKSGRATACKTKKKTSRPNSRSSWSTLTSAGFRNIEAASFVSPKWVPQMATSAEVMAAINAAPA